MHAEKAHKTNETSVGFGERNKEKEVMQSRRSFMVSFLFNVFFSLLAVVFAAPVATYTSDDRYDDHPYVCVTKPNTCMEGALMIV